VFPHLSRGGAGVGEELGDGVGGGVGDGDADGDLAVFLAVDGVEVEGLKQLFGQADGAPVKMSPRMGRASSRAGSGISVVAVSSWSRWASRVFCSPWSSR
jgi:hypothetical protein